MGELCDKCAFGPKVEKVPTTKKGSEHVIQEVIPKEEKPTTPEKMYVCCPSYKGFKKSGDSHYLLTIDTNKLYKFLQMEKPCILPGTKHLDCACKNSSERSLKTGALITQYGAQFALVDPIEYLLDVYATLVPTEGEAQVLSDTLEYFPMSPHVVLTCDDPNTNTTGFIIFIVMVCIGAFAFLVVAAWFAWQLVSGISPIRRPSAKSILAKTEAVGTAALQDPAKRRLTPATKEAPGKPQQKTATKQKPPVKSKDYSPV